MVPSIRSAHECHDPATGEIVPFVVVTDSHALPLVSAKLPASSRCVTVPVSNTATVTRLVLREELRLGRTESGHATRESLSSDAVCWTGCSPVLDGR